MIQAKLVGKHIDLDRAIFLKESDFEPITTRNPVFLVCHWALQLVKQQRTRSEDAHIVFNQNINRIITCITRQ